MVTLHDIESHWVMLQSSQDNLRGAQGRIWGALLF